MNNEQKGPYALSQIQNMWNSGGITSDSQYWDAEGEKWKPITELIETATPATNAPSPIYIQQAHDPEKIRESLFKGISRFIKGYGVVLQILGAMMCVMAIVGLIFLSLSNGVYRIFPFGIIVIPPFVIGLTFFIVGRVMSSKKE